MSKFESQRELHLVDIENLYGGTGFSCNDVVRIRRRYGAVADPISSAQFVLATSARMPGLEAGLGWMGCRLLIRPGTDGADLALVEVAETENLAGRFERVVIGSGDGIFANAAANLARLGCDILVVCRRGGLSRRLALAASEVRYIDDLAQIAAMPVRWSA